MTFVLDCCDREVISFVAKKGRGLPSWMAQEQVLLAVNRRFGSVKPSADSFTAFDRQWLGLHQSKNQTVFEGAWY